MRFAVYKSSLGRDYHNRIENFYILIGVYRFTWACLAFFAFFGELSTYTGSHYSATCRPSSELLESGHSCKTRNWESFYDQTQSTTRTVPLNTSLKSRRITFHHSFLLAPAVRTQQYNACVANSFATNKTYLQEVPVVIDCCVLIGHN